MSMRVGLVYMMQLYHHGGYVVYRCLFWFVVNFVGAHAHGGDEGGWRWQTNETSLCRIITEMRGVRK